MSRIVKLCIIVVVLFIGLAFHLRNDQFVLFDYYLGSFELPFSFMVVAAFSIGAVAGVLALVPTLTKLKAENHKLLRRVQVSEKEINNLRILPIKDEH